MLCSRQDVIDIGFGGDTSEAVKLTRSEPQNWDPSKLDMPIKMGSADVELAAGNRFSIPYSDDPTTYSFALRKIAAMRAVYYCWFTYSRGQAAGDLVKAVQEATDRDLTAMRDSKTGAGTVKPPPRRIYGVADIDLTNGGTVPRMSLAGWRRL
jgi:hypothetical protein